MPTLQQLNADAARRREFLQGATRQTITVPGSTRVRGPSPLPSTGNIQGSLQVARRDASGQVLGFSNTSPFLTQARTSTRSGTTSRTGGGSNIPGVGAGIFGVEGALQRSGPSALLQSSGDVSRRFDTSGFDRAGNLRPTGGGGGGDTGTRVSLQTSDIQSQLDALLTQITEAGGTPQSQAASGKRAAATDALLNTVQTLTPAAAQAQAQGLVDNITRSILDEVLPQLQAAGEGAGASRSALDQLQLNDVATRIAEKSASVVINAITGFAGAQAGAGQVVERLTATDPISQELISLITQTPSESSQTSGSVDILNQLGLLPKDLDADTINQLFLQNAA